MRTAVDISKIENIDEVRRQEGIDDVELRIAIRELGIGDSVNLTLLNGKSFPGDTVTVRITSIRGHTFRGKLTTKPASRSLSYLVIGSPVFFTTEHIHSLPRG